MTWAEFQLRLISFNRSEKRNEYKLRRQAWITFIAPYQDPKKLKSMTESKFWYIDGDVKKGVSEATKERFRREYDKYLEIKNGTA
jgi:hypothetical protein